MKNLWAFLDVSDTDHLWLALWGILLLVGVWKIVAGRQSKPTVFEEFEDAFPGKCATCAYHAYGIRHGHVPPETVPEPHRCPEKGARWKGALHKRGSAPAPMPDKKPAPKKQPEETKVGGNYECLACHKPAVICSICKKDLKRGFPVLCARDNTHKHTKCPDPKEPATWN